MTAKYFVSVFLVQCIGLFVYSQEAIYQRLIASKDDTIKVNGLHDYAQELLDKDNSKARSIYKITLELSSQLDYDLGMATAYRKVGYINGQEGQYLDAIDCFRKAIAYYEKGGGRIKDIVVCINNLGVNFKQIGNVDSAMSYYLSGIKKIQAWPLDREDPAVRMDLLSSLALLHENISSSYGNLYNVPKAIEYGEKAMKIAKEINDTVRIIQATISTAHAFYVGKDFRKALNLSKKAAALADVYGAPVAIAKAYHALSVSYTGLNQPDSGIYAAKISMKHAKESDQQLYITSFLDLADAYHDKKAFAEEASVLQSALKEFKEVNNVTFGANVYEKLAAAKYALGQYKEAYDLYIISADYKDSIFSQQNRESVAALEVQYQTAEKEKALSSQQLQIAQKNLELQRSRQYIFYSIGALLVALLIAALIFVSYRNKRKQHLRELKAIQQQRELQLLQAVMQGEEKERSRIAKDLHDGVAGMLAAVKMHFNSIALNVGGVLQTEGYQQGIRLLDEASQDVRKTSHNLMPEVLLQHGLDEAIRRYCNNVTSSSKLVVQYDSIGEMGRFVDSFELSVYRIVQELLNNIVKHSKASEAIVQITFQQQLLSITIEDNGIGFSNDGQQKDGIGLKSLQSRVKAMNGKIEFDSTVGQGLNAYLEFETAGLEKKIESMVA